MADRIKGITIKIGGDTTGLSKALQGTNKEIKNTQSQLKDVERLLKMDPGNTELIAQKHRLLGDAVDETKGKLKQLQSYDKQLQSQLKSGVIGQEQYDAFQREIAETKTELNNLKSQYKNSSVFAQKFSQANSKISSSAGKVSSAFRPATATILGLGAAAVASVEGTEELRTDLSKLDQNAKTSGDSVDNARNAFKKFAVATDETDSAVEATSNLLQAGFTGSNLQTVMEGITGAYLKFPDTLKVESLADSLQETLATGNATGQFGELLDRLGIGADNFSQKLASCSTEAEKQNLIMQTLSGAGLNDMYNGWLQNNDALVSGKESTMELQLQMAELAETLQPIISKVLDIAAKVLEWFNNLSPAGKILIAVILGIVAAISPIAGIIAAISAASAASPVTWIVLGIVAAVAALIAIIVLLVENWDKVKEAAQNAIDKISGYIDKMVGKIREAIDWFKSLFGWKDEAEQSSSSSFTGRANGGPVSVGDMAVVGERGPEVLQLTAAGATVTPLTAPRSATFNNSFTFNGHYTESDGRAITEEINKQLGRIF